MKNINSSLIKANDMVLNFIERKILEKTDFAKSPKK